MQIGAAAVALTDRELKKKPWWFRDAVSRLETAIVKAGNYGYIESKEALAKMHDTLQRVSDLEETELLWRYARVLIEEADLSLFDKEKEMLYREAFEYLKKAVLYEGAKPCAGAHKWYAIALMRLSKFEEKKEKRKAYSSDIRNQLALATEINPDDPHAWLLYGISLHEDKNYKKAIECYQKAESIKQHFSSANMFHLGEAQKALGDKKAAIESWKTSYLIKPKNMMDTVARLDARKRLQKYKIAPKDFVPLEAEW